MVGTLPVKMRKVFTIDETSLSLSVAEINAASAAFHKRNGYFPKDDRQILDEFLGRRPVYASFVSTPSKAVHTRKDILELLSD